MKKVILFFGTGGGVGYFPFFPGTAGTLWGVVVCFFIQRLGGGYIPQLVVTGGILFLAVFVSGKCEKILEKKDHRVIVIDEIAGFMVALAGIPFSNFSLILGFFLFRLFDIFKPFHIDRLQELPGGWGVVSDDVAAGALTNILLRILFSMAGF
ncbi:phosphatidylglycerophosphatase A [Candidatus Aerophobetes bacterium]|nr:phosphatidylglycerophosphatase A [Candidatus Aerophobetes bacterium]